MKIILGIGTAKSNELILRKKIDELIMSKMMTVNFLTGS